MTRKGTIYIALCGALCICGILFITRSSSFAPTSYARSFKPPLIDQEVIQDWVAPDVYAYIMARVDDYLRATNTPASFLTVKDGVTTNTATYSFNLIANPNSQILQILATVSNTDGVLSTAVSINGQLQGPTVPATNTNAPGSTYYTGFDSLINQGLTAVQSDELQQALTSFAPSASSISIDPNTAVSGDLIAGTTTRPFTFTITIDSKQYKATLNAIGLLQAQLLLNDPAHANHQVFDSGVINQGS